MTCWLLAASLYTVACISTATLLGVLLGAVGHLTRGFTGAKEGCAEGGCGACAVLMVRRHGQGSAYVPVNSCLMFVPMAAGQEIYTVEALANGARLAPVQQAMVDCGGSQCGYCTPGFVISMFAEQYRPGRSGACDIHALSGNLCRCASYVRIRAGIKRAAELSTAATPAKGGRS